MVHNGTAMGRRRTGLLTSSSSGFVVAAESGLGLGIARAIPAKDRTLRRAMRMGKCMLAGCCWVRK